MEVLKSGKDNKSFGKELTCIGYGVGKNGGCGALLLVKPKDIEAHYHDGDSSYWFICPECKAKTYVKESSLKSFWSHL